MPASEAEARILSAVERLLATSFELICEGAGVLFLWEADFDRADFGAFSVQPNGMWHLPLHQPPRDFLELHAQESLRHAKPYRMRAVCAKTGDGRDKIVWIDGHVAPSQMDLTWRMETI